MEPMTNNQWIAYGQAHLVGAQAHNYELLSHLVGRRQVLRKLSPALLELVRRDLQRLGSARSGTRSPERLVEQRLQRAHELALRTYRGLGFDTPDLTLRIQEDFPDPYSNPALWGVMVDQQDARELGLEAGLYVRPSTAYPGLGEATVCHETVHTLFSYIESDALVHGYEEGVCDLLAYLPLSRLFGYRGALNILLSHRMYVEDTLDRVYRDALRQVAAHLLWLGEEKWLATVRSAQRDGREKFIEVEQRLLSGSVVVRPRLASRGSPATGKLQRIALTLLATPESYSLSPESFLLAERATVGDTLARLRRRLQRLVPGDSFDSALRSLRDDFHLVVVDKGKVIANEAKRYINAGVCRYRL